jgi:hypothetical protein
MPNTYFRKNNVDLYDLYRDQARRIDGVIKMRGVFQAACLPDYEYDHIFVPSDEGELTTVIPVFEGCRVIDIVAYAGNTWGCVSGQGTHLGTITNPLRVYRSPAEWLAGDDGVLPLTKSLAEQAARAKISF